MLSDLIESEHFLLSELVDDVWVKKVNRFLLLHFEHVQEKVLS